MTTDWLPSELLAVTKLHGGWRYGPVAIDTETSGLYPDDGARVSTVSVAWIDRRDEWEHARVERCDVNGKGERLRVMSMAWPFDQGVGSKGIKELVQDSLFGDELGASNLGPGEWGALLEWLRLVGSTTDLVMHNALFDTLLMSAGTRTQPGIDLRDYVGWDTMLASRLIWPMASESDGRATAGLKPLSRILWGVSEADEQGVIKAYLKRHKLPPGRWDLMPWDIVAPYAEQDARLTIRLWAAQRGAIDRGEAGSWIGDPGEVYQAIDLEVDVMRVLSRMEERGLPYDQAESRRVALELRDRQKTIALPFAPNVNAAKKYLFDIKGYTPPAVTAKGAPSLAGSGIDDLVAQGIPEAELWRDWQKADTARKMWYNGYAEMVGADDRLRTRFRQTGTVSGRFSCERVNLQAIPQDYRLADATVLEGLPTPRAVIRSAVEKHYPGWSLWELDLAQAELRVAALRARQETMLELIAQGADLHGATAGELFNAKKGDKGWFEYRQVAKRGNFSLIFGSGGDTFSRMIKNEVGWTISKREADRLVAQWNGLYPEFSRAINTAADAVFMRVKKAEGIKARARRDKQVIMDAGPYVTTWGGHRRWFSKGEDYRKAFNQNVQGALAILAKRWLLRTEAVCNKAGVQARALTDGIGGAGLLLVIHDSMVVLLPDDQAEAITAQIRQEGLQVWADMFPEVPGDIDIGRFGVK